MKITHSDKNISPFGGFNFCCGFSKKPGLAHLIDEHLGKRVVIDRGFTADSLAGKCNLYGQNRASYT